MQTNNRRRLSLASRSPHETSNLDVGCVLYARTLGTGIQLGQRRGPLIQTSQVQAIFNKIGQLVSILGEI